MGYLHQPIMFLGSAVRSEIFKRFVKLYDAEIGVALILFEDSGLGGFEYDDIKRPDFSNREYVLNHIKKESLSEIEKIKGYTRNQKMKLRAIFKKMKTDESFYKSAVTEYQKFLDSLVERKTGHH